MQNIISGQGFVNENGELFLKDFKKELNSVLNSDIIKNMNITEIQTLGSVLHKIVGDKINETIVNTK